LELWILAVPRLELVEIAMQYFQGAEVWVSLAYSGGTNKQRLGREDFAHAVRQLLDSLAAPDPSQTPPGHLQTQS
jgi:hypothetical protein